MADMDATPVALLARAIERLYEVFRAYGLPPVVSSCLHCYTSDELEAFRAVPLRELESHLAGELLRETGDHWETQVAYKHYLPRMLEALAPPGREEALYPGASLRDARISWLRFVAAS